MAILFWSQIRFCILLTYALGQEDLVNTFFGEKGGELKASGSPLKARTISSSKISTLERVSSFKAISYQS